MGNARELVWDGRTFAGVWSPPFVGAAVAAVFYHFGRSLVLKVHGFMLVKARFYVSSGFAFWTSYVVVFGPI